ncbi:MAG: hypothetical protein LJE84_07130 [Gammaproteobacteria bacterium]|nr:hypothetical protein [Gammaproteobacteria bacterium]
MRLLDRLAALLGSTAPDVYSLHHQHNHNLGDRYCTPLAFLAHRGVRPRALHMSLTDRRVRGLRDSWVILGGGGLLNPWCWNEVIVPLHERGNRLVAWGIGHHHDDVPEFRYRSGTAGHWRDSLASYLQDYPPKTFSLCGLRDQSPDLAGAEHVQYVPCPSCLHPAFDGRYPIRHEHVVYEQSVLDSIPINGPRRGNLGDTPLESLLSFLGSGESILTNSYHGAYWGLLLGRRVVLYEPWCTKFALMPVELPAANADNWRRLLPGVAAPVGFLEDCRRRNTEFGQSVLAAMDNHEK